MNCSFAYNVVPCERRQILLPDLQAIFDWEIVYPSTVVVVVLIVRCIYYLRSKRNGYRVFNHAKLLKLVKRITYWNFSLFLVFYCLSIIVYPGNKYLTALACVAFGYINIHAAFIGFVIAGFRPTDKPRIAIFIGSALCFVGGYLLMCAWSVFWSPSLCYGFVYTATFGALISLPFGAFIFWYIEVKDLVQWENNNPFETIGTGAFSHRNREIVRNPLAERSNQSRNAVTSDREHVLFRTDLPRGARRSL